MDVVVLVPVDVTDEVEDDVELTLTVTDAPVPVELDEVTYVVVDDELRAPDNRRPSNVPSTIHIGRRDMNIGVKSTCRKN